MKTAVKKWCMLLVLVCVLLCSGTAGAETVTGAGAAMGFSGDITVTITLKAGKITAVYVDHDETPGLGGMAVDKLADAIVSSNSLNIDVIASATITSKAMLAAAKNALLAAGLDPNDYMNKVETEPEAPSEPDDDVSNIPAGAFTGTAKGFSGDITVGITHKNGKITAVYVDHDETPALGGMAVDKLADAIVSSNSLNIDVIASATITSKAMLAAAKNALIAAGLDPNDYMNKVETEPEAPSEPDDDVSNIPAGAFTGTAKGFSGDITVGITHKNGKITAVYVDHDETAGFGDKVAEQLGAAIVNSNSLNVDTIAGATFTSKAVLAAAKNALLNAGLDPNDYMGKDGTTTKPGDPDGDGSVTISDALVVLRHCAGENVGFDLDAADVTGDGKADVQDVLRILQYDAGWDVKLQ